MHQAMFVAHDAGHMNLTGSRFIDYGIGGFLASFCSGLSLGWWVSVRRLLLSLSPLGLAPQD